MLRQSSLGISRVWERLRPPSTEYFPPRCTRRYFFVYPSLMAYSDKFLTDGEKVITEFRPHWRLLFIPMFWLLAGIVAIVLVNGTIPPEDGTIDMITSVVILLALIPLVVVPLINWWFTAYILTNERLITRSGVIARSGVEIPLENIANVLFHQNVIERVLGSGDLLIESASSTELVKIAPNHWLRPRCLQLRRREFPTRWSDSNALPGCTATA